jgi:hypothetical protein
MNAVLLTACVTLLAVVAALLWQLKTERVGLRAVQADHTRLQLCLSHNLRAVRAMVGYGFPEAVAVCTALETAVQARCRVDLTLLERTLMVHRRAHNAALLGAARLREDAPPRQAHGSELSALSSQLSTVRQGGAA